MDIFRHQSLYADVAVPSPLRRTFCYRIPGALEGLVERGMRVVVPFGRQRQVAVVVGLSEHTQVAAERLRDIVSVLDNQPLLDDATLALLEWGARYYHHPVGEVIQTALPTLFRRERNPAASRERRGWRAIEPPPQDTDALLKRAHKQADLLRLLQAEPGLTRAQLEARLPGAGNALRALVRKGLAEATTALAGALSQAPAAAPALTDAQRDAVDALHAAPGFEVFVLDGVTGSGKTEVYLQAAQAVLQRGQQALVLVPEIGLTPQMVARFGERLGTEPAVLHSGMADGARRDTWAAARDGKVQLVLGTRSSVFTPLPRLGLIVIDEEHDLSYKQQDGFRYSARDLALVRAQRADVPVVLGSATPSMETLYNVRQHRYTHLSLPARAGAAAMPQLHIVDMRARSGFGTLSAALRNAMKEALARGEQSLLFINRRGFAPALICADCGHVHDCRRCDARLVLHRADARLVCHHCGHTAPVPTRCGECGSSSLRPVGHGTQRLEAELREHFPGTALERVDRDSTRRQGALEASLERARSGAASILIGTQMLAKGHHFPGVTVVGIIDADSGLFSTDFRAPERLAQLIVQVSGRAGRAERAGHVYIQTLQPEHPLLMSLVHGDYAHFAVQVLEEREAAALPPYCALALLRAEAPRREACVEFLSAAAEVARGLTSEVMALGPVPAPMERRQGRYREQLLLQAADRARLQAMLKPFAVALETLPQGRRARWSLDVDPQDLS